MNSMIRPELLSLTAEQTRALGPILWVTIGAILTVITCVFRRVSAKWTTFFLLIATAVMGILSAGCRFTDPSITLFNGMMVVDAYSQFFNIIFLACAGMSAAASVRYLDNEKLQYAEYYVLLLFSALGMMFMVSSLDLIVLFVSLELMSLTVYTLVGFRRADRRSNEAAMKYFILGGVASAILLYGTALLYGATGSTHIKVIGDAVQANASLMTPAFVLGAWLLALGFLFKVASVPFHMWMPDVYEGAPTPVTGFMTTGLKAAAFAAFLRVFVSVGYGSKVSEFVQHYIHDILWVSALATMLIGNVVALLQTNLKRMLAYSSIAHTGYLIVGLIAGSQSDQGFSPVVMYLASYAIMNLGAFVILTLIGGQKDVGLNLFDIAGLSKKHPWLAFSMAVFLFSMAGIPPTAGFTAKYLLFYSAVQAGEIWLVILSVLCSAISVYYYLRVLVYMYMKDPAGSTPGVARYSIMAGAVLTAMVVLTLQIGLQPAKIIAVAQKAMASL